MICKLCCSESSEKQKSNWDEMSKDFMRENACVSETERESGKKKKMEELSDQEALRPGSESHSE